MILAQLHHPVKAYQRESEDNGGEKLRQSFMPTYSSHTHQMRKKKKHQMTEAAIETLSLLGSLAFSSAGRKTNGISQHTQVEYLLQSPLTSEARGKKHCQIVIVIAIL